MSDARHTPSDFQFGEEDIDRVLELADGHLEDAENVLWNASKRASEDDVAEDLEALTQAVWDLQHRIDDLQHDR